MGRDAGKIEEYARWFRKRPLNFGKVKALGTHDLLSCLPLIGMHVNWQDLCSTRPQGDFPMGPE